MPNMPFSAANRLIPVPGMPDLNMPQVAYGGKLKPPFLAPPRTTPVNMPMPNPMLKPGQKVSAFTPADIRKQLSQLIYLNMLKRIVEGNNPNQVNPFGAVGNDPYGIGRKIAGYVNDYSPMEGMGRGPY